MRLVHSVQKTGNLKYQITDFVISMSDVADSKDLLSSISELESLGLETPNLNELNDAYEVENLVQNLKQMLFQKYKCMPVFTD